LQVPSYSLTIFGRYKRCTWTDGYTKRTNPEFYEILKSEMEVAPKKKPKKVAKKKSKKKSKGKSKK
jgi:hypothetical protein